MDVWAPKLTRGIADKFAQPSDEDIAALDRTYLLIKAFRDRDHRMTSSYITAFLAVARFPGEGPTFYASKLGATQPVASRVLQEIGTNPRVKGKGLELVDSEIDPANRRQHRYFLTQRGRGLLRDVINIMGACDK
jgi:DNA-binding MarR family transcriptional regulator